MLIKEASLFPYNNLEALGATDRGRSGNVGRGGISMIQQWSSFHSLDFRERDMLNWTLFPYDKKGVGMNSPFNFSKPGKWN